MSKQLFAPDLTKIDTAAKFNLGDTYIKPDGSTYKYMQADGAVVVFCRSLNRDSSSQWCLLTPCA